MNNTAEPTMTDEQVAAWVEMARTRELRERLGDPDFVVHLRRRVIAMRDERRAR